MSPVQRAMQQAAKTFRGHFPSIPFQFNSWGKSIIPTSFVFLGPPGVGKGTYSQRVAEALKVPCIASGDLVRKEMKAGSMLGSTVSFITYCLRKLD